MNKQWQCKLIGHRCDERYTDGGYAICLRCGAHAYYDGAEFQLDFMYWPLRLWWKALEAYRDWRWWRAVKRDAKDIPF